MTTTDRYSGDLAVYLTVDGSNIKIVSGQPVLDCGIETAVLVSLFTESPWIGNAISEDGGAGSDFMSFTRQPITLSTVNDMRDAAERALKWIVDDGAADEITVSISNPNGQQLAVAIRITPHGTTAREILISRFGLLWQAQVTDPVSDRIGVQ